MSETVSRETRARLDHYERLVRAENEQQNLVAASTLDEFHVRHEEDARQLIALAPASASWCDIGSGAGLPGMVIAIITGAPMTLVEPRRLRAEFLVRAAQELGLDNVTVVQAKAQNVHGRFDVVTARAVARLSALFEMALHLTHDGTRWILPKGRGANMELEAARQSWQGRFAMVPSVTSPDAMIVIAEHVARRGKR